MIRVLIAEGNKEFAFSISELINKESDLTVCGIVTEGKEIEKRVKNLKPDVLLLDIEMPKGNSIEVIRILMHSLPLPIVVMSAMDVGYLKELTFKALEEGAVALVSRPSPNSEEKKREEKKLTDTLRLMSEVKVITRRKKITRNRDMRPVTINYCEPVVVIGASTGGPPVLQTILRNLPSNFNASILIVQHITEGFVQGLQEWLNRTTGIEVSIAVNREQIKKGHAYLAPDNYQMGIDKLGRIVLVDEPPENNLKPSVSYLFRSARKIYGKSLIAILLTGMGKDGAEEMLKIREIGGITIVQDKDTSVVYGMPGAAAKLNAALYYYDPLQIALKLPELVSFCKKDNKWPGIK
ncbi:chemotaxis protein CheB [Chitinispirillales bacterium ANBcel5]|uniref:chemotaxis protein CheB n=1 Tax=Cellulosispirillum alkaliphilum TaxID=3039283 RepID=UPI002A5646E4|nr:chemotaxis protein CheB [Chitinispirillales bacterium ANBcel5]